MSYRRQQLALGRGGGGGGGGGGSIIDTSPYKRMTKKKKRKKLQGSQSAPNLHMDGSIEKYEMWTLPIPSKTVKKGWATPQEIDESEKDRILKKLEMKKFDLKPVPRESVMTKDGKRRKLPKMVV